jgi:hypothetical protein
MTSSVNERFLDSIGTDPNWVYKTPKKSGKRKKCGANSTVSTPSAEQRTEKTALTAVSHGALPASSFSSSLKSVQTQDFLKSVPEDLQSLLTEKTREMVRNWPASSPALNTSQILELNLQNIKSDVEQILSRESTPPKKPMSKSRVEKPKTTSLSTEVPVRAVRIRTESIDLSAVPFADKLSYPVRHLLKQWPISVLRPDKEQILEVDQLVKDHFSLFSDYDETLNPVNNLSVAQNLTSVLAIIDRKKYPELVNSNITDVKANKMAVEYLKLVFEHNKMLPS